MTGIVEIEENKLKIRIFNSYPSVVRLSHI